jgi:uracil-DNA glycosylase
MSQTTPPLQAEDYWTADQLRVMHGLELPAWFSPVAHVAQAAQVAQVLQSLSVKLEVVVYSALESAVSMPAIEALNTLDISALSQAASQCQACRLGKVAHPCRKPIALDAAQSSAQWLIVVDDAHLSDALLSEPAQRLLSAMLASVGKSMDAVSVTSLLKCARSADVNLDAYSDEVQACQPFLRQQMALLKPSLVIAMGELAAQALVGVDDELSQLVGEVHEYEGLPLLVMPHPEVLLRQPALKAQVWRDLNWV